MASAPLPLLLLTQSMSAFSELFGQRVIRLCHHHSNLRSLVSASVYVSMQSTVVLGVAEVALPASITGGQGPFSILPLLASSPSIWLNAVNNAFYWIGVVLLLREPFGAVLLVLAFLCASFLVAPFLDALGLPGGGALPALLAALGAAGALLCVAEVPLPVAREICARIACCACAHRRCGHAAIAPRAELSAGAGSAALSRAEGGAGVMRGADGGGESDARDGAAGSGSAAESDASAIEERAAERSRLIVEATRGASARADAHFSDDASMATPNSVDAPPSAREQPLERAAAAPAMNVALPPASAAAAAPLVLLRVAAAFALVALTTCLGIAFISHFERRLALNAFGYTAADALLLPLSTLPLVALLERAATLRRLIGEPRWSQAEERAPSFAALVARAWREVCAVPPGEPPLVEEAPRASAAASEEAAVAAAAPRGTHSAGLSLSRCRKPWPFFYSLAAFHSIEFARSLLLFHLVTAYDTSATYATMTLIRVALCWFASLLACSLLRRFIGFTVDEARTALHPVNIAVRAGGASLLVAVLLLA